MQNRETEVIQIDSEFWSVTCRDLDKPLRSLLVAILERAIWDLNLKPSSYGWKAARDAWKVRREARIWFRARDCDPWSFRWLVDHLQLDGEVLKGKLTNRGLLDHELDPDPSSVCNAEALASVLNGDRWRA